MKKIYKIPKNAKKDFELIEKEKNIIGIKNKKMGYSILFREGGHLPNSGLLFCKSLNKFDFSNKKVFDVGVEESGILSIHASYLGAKEVIGIDVDSDAVCWAKKNVEKNHLSSKIKIRKDSIFRNNLPTNLDFILSNPPQVPSPEITLSATHDSGGRDGRIFIKKLIDLGKRNLKEGGMLIFTAFDFLGVEKPYGKNGTLFQLLKKNRMNPLLIDCFSKEARKGGYTEKSLGWIKMIYPFYKERRSRNGNLLYNMFIVGGRLF